MNKDDLLKFNDCKVESVEVPEWDCTLHIRSMSGHERAQLQSKIVECEKTNRWAEAYATAVCLGIAHANGDRLFSDKDFDKIMEKRADVVERLAIAVSHHNGLSANSLDAAKKDTPVNQI
jgi:endonuclease IV